MNVSSKSIRFVSFIVAAILALPLRFGAWTGLFLWMSPFILLNALLAGKRIVDWNLLGVAACLGILLRPRWFCHYACPAGVLCDAASRCAVRRTTLAHMPPVHQWLCVGALVLALLGVPLLMILDPINLFYAFFDGGQPLPLGIKLLKISGLLTIVLLNIWVPHGWCQRLCPLGGLQDLVTQIKTALHRNADRSYRRFIPGRRYAITGVAGLIAGLGLRNGTLSSSNPVLRPPSSIQESWFQIVCSRCGNCIKSCPTNIIQSCFNSGGWIGVLTPFLTFERSYCLFDCTNCGDVCPSGAITPFRVEDKKHLRIGLARIRLDDCLLLHNRECDRCKTSCGYDAIRIQSPEDEFYSYPEIISDRCAGCGACKIICPAEVIEIVPR